MLTVATLGHLVVAEELPTSDAYAITSGQVLIEPGKVLDNATVVVRKGVIEAVGVDVPVPFDALVIPASGMLVHAGFIDAGNVSGYDPAQRRSFIGPAEPLAVNVTAYAATPTDDRRLLSPEFLVAHSLRWDADDLENWRLRGFTSRHILPTDGILGGQSAVVNLAGGSLRDTLLRESAVSALAFKESGQGYPSTLMGMMAHVRQILRDADAAQRAAQATGTRTGLPADPALKSLWPVLARQQRLAIIADTEDEIYRALNLAREFRVKPLIVGGAEAWKVVDRLKEEKVAVLSSLNLPAEPGKNGSSQRPRSSAEPKEPKEAKEKQEEKDSDADLPQRVVEDRHRRWVERFQGVKKLHDAGVTVGLTLSGVKPDDFAKNVKLLMDKGGLSADLLLSLLTQQAAKALELDAEIGRIAPGMRAHLVIRHGEFTDPKTWVRQVLIDRELFEYAAVKSSEEKDDEKPDAEKKVARKSAKTKDAESKPKENPGPEVATELESDRKPRWTTGGDILLRGATVLTVSKAGDRQDTDILVTDGKIVEIGSDLRAPKGTITVEAGGLYVMPGIIDTHSHMAISRGVNEATLSITPEVRIRDVVDSKDETIYRALAGGTTTARLLHGSANTIGGQDAVIKLRYGRPAPELIVDSGPQGIKFALGENVKRRQGRFPNSRMGVEAVLVRAFSEAQAYRREWEQYKSKPNGSGPPPRFDYRLDALARVLSGDIQVHCHCYRQDEILMLLRVADQFGVKIRSLQHALEAYKIAPEVAKHGCSISTFADWWAYKWEAYDATPFNLALLREAGVPTCLKSDSGELIRHLYQDAAKMLRYGLDDPQAALESVTIIAAEQLGLSDRIGSIETGKDADLAVFNGHPLNTYARCVLTLVDGEVYFEDRRQFQPSTTQEPIIAQSSPPPTDLRLPPIANPSQPLDLDADSNDKVFAIVNTAIHPVGRASISKGTVVIRDGKFTFVGSGRVVPDDAKVIDAGGLHAYPGLIDAGTKVGLIEVGSAEETIDYREEGPFQPDLRAATAVHPDSEIIPVTRAGGITSVVTLPASGILSGQSALVNLAGWVPTDMVVLDPLALHVSLPAVPRTPEKAPQAFMGRGRFASLRARRLEEIRSLFRLAEHYARAKAEAKKRGENSPVVDPRLEAIEPYLRRNRPVIFQADTAKDIQEAIRFGEELGVRIVIRGGRDAWKVTSDLVKHNVPVIVGPVMTPVGAEYDPYDAPFRNLSSLHQAGVRFCIQSDETTNARNLPFEAAMAVAYGLPAEEGLKAITIHAAQILGVDETLGSIEEGKLGNLVLTTGDPLQAATRIHGVFIAGRPFEPASKHTRLYERYRQRLHEVDPSTRAENEKPEPVPR